MNGIAVGGVFGYTQLLQTPGSSVESGMVGSVVTDPVGGGQCGGVHIPSADTGGSVGSDKVASSYCGGVHTDSANMAPYGSCRHQVAV